MKNTIAQITNIHVNIMGTCSFDGKFHGMRKAQDFIVYPMQDSGTQIKIQSDHRFGIIDTETGKGILSANRAQYANSLFLQICVSNGTAIKFALDMEELQTLRQWIKSTGGENVGSSLVKSSNIGAIAL